jgi:hypothetical protein
MTNEHFQIARMAVFYRLATSKKLSAFERHESILASTGEIASNEK